MSNRTQSHRTNARRTIGFLLGGLALALPIVAASSPAAAQGRPGRNDAYAPPPDAPRSGWRDEPAYRQPLPEEEPAYRPPTGQGGYGQPQFEPVPPSYGGGRADDAYRPPGQGYGGRDDRADYGGHREGGTNAGRGGYGEPYHPPRELDDRGYDRRSGPYASSRDLPPQLQAERGDGTFSMSEIKGTGHRFFGGVSQGFASAIEYVFQKSGRPNGYILGEDVGGAFIAGLRYGEGTLHTKDAGSHKVYWQGPSIGYDAGAEGSKVMVLVYNLKDPQEIYNRFGGVAGSAYVVGGVGVTYQQNDEVVLAPIRAGIGLRLGANVGYLKYTRRPTWNPF